LYRPPPPHPTLPLRLLFSWSFFFLNALPTRCPILFNSRTRTFVPPRRDSKTWWRHNKRGSETRARVFCWLIGALCHRLLGYKPHHDTPTRAPEVIEEEGAFSLSLSLSPALRAAKSKEKP